MIEKVKDLELNLQETAEQVEQALQEKLGIGVADMTTVLQQYMQQHAEELAANFLTVIPHEDWTGVLEEPEHITKFFREDAANPVNWKMYGIQESQDPKQPNMLKFTFRNKAVNDGEDIRGYVFVSFAGKIMHFFVHGDP